MLVARTKTAVLVAFLAPVCGVTARLQLKAPGVAPSGFDSLVDEFADPDDDDANDLVRAHIRSRTPEERNVQHPHFARGESQIPEDAPGPVQVELIATTPEERAERRVAKRDAHHRAMQQVVVGRSVSIPEVLIVGFIAIMWMVCIHNMLFADAPYPFGAADEMNDVVAPPMESLLASPLPGLSAADEDRFLEEADNMIKRSFAPAFGG